jgi:FdhD protein
MSMTAKSQDAAVRRRTADRQVVVVRDGARMTKPDVVVTEEPMEIRAEGPGQEARTVAVTMRTPGHDFELAVGFLATEGMVGPRGVATVRYCEAVRGEEQRHNVVTVSLADRFDDALSRRAMVTSASCGICGTESIERLEREVVASDPNEGPWFDAALVRRMPELVRGSQPTFERTGGLHAAALVDATGEASCVREDVGRHNAVDKVVGRAVLDGRLPLSDRALFVSGRVSYEIIQKAAMAGLRVVVAVGAPSSLALETAERLGMTVAGFVRDGAANVYTHPGRVRG